MVFHIDTYLTLMFFLLLIGMRQLMQRAADLSEKEGRIIPSGYREEFVICYAVLFA